MSTIDIRTVSIMMVLTDLLSAFLLTLLWLQARSRFKGLGYWTVDFILQAAGMFLILLRGAIPDSLSVVTANVFVAGGSLLGLLGYGRFLGKQIRLPFNILLLLLFSAIHFWFGLVNPHIGPRNINIGTYLLILDAEVLWLLFRHTEKAQRRIVAAPVVVHILFAVLGFARFIEYFSGPGNTREDTFFQVNAFSSFGFLIYQLLLIALTYSFVIMVSQRLLAEVWGEHQKFSKSFYGAPYAMLLARMPSGVIVEVNKGFELLTGYDSADVINRKILDLGIWEDLEERKAVLAELEATGRTEEREVTFRRKNGSKADVLLSSETLTIEGEEMALAAISDISDRKRMEEKIRDLSRRDPLTGIFNRRHAFELLERMVVDANDGKEDGGFSIALLDMDFFKGINDRYGHLAGDLALTRLTETILSHIGGLKAGATAARYGGEEFVVFFPGLGKAEAAAVMTDILEKYRSIGMEWAGTRFSCTFSCGIADSAELGLTGALTIESIVALVDKRMYEAKHGGRNRICAD